MGRRWLRAAPALTKEGDRMSIFSFPRINVKGLLVVNVGTANNDDYSGSQFPPSSPFAGQPVRLADSQAVQPLTYGMTDEQYIEWVQQPHAFVKPAPPAQAASQKTTKAEDGAAPPGSPGAERAAAGAGPQ